MALNPPPAPLPQAEWCLLPFPFPSPPRRASTPVMANTAGPVAATAAGDMDTETIMQSSGFQDVLQKAAAIKGAQLAEKRLEWERAPDFMKETIGAPDDVRASRSSSAQERRAVCLAYKQKGNDFFAVSKHGTAMREFVRALAVYRWFDQSTEKSSERMPLIRGESLISEERDATEARGVVHTLLLNIAACCVKLGDGASALYACDEALALDPQSAKGLYRRSQAHLLEGTVSGQERALKDLGIACKLKPDDMQLRTALRNLRTEYDSTTKHERQRLKKGFESGLYSESEKEEFAARQPSASEDASASGKDVDPNWWKPPYSAAARAHARSIGLDLDDKRVQAALAKMHAEQTGDTWSWRTLVRRLFDSKRVLSVPVIGYVLIALHVVYRIYRIMSAPLAASPERSAHHVGGGWDDSGAQAGGGGVSGW